jgi:hypothetical protein
MGILISLVVGCEVVECRKKRRKCGDEKKIERIEGKRKEERGRSWLEQERRKRGNTGWYGGDREDGWV